MRVTIIRHGPAGDKEKWAESGRPDEARPLTAQGRRKMLAAAHGLARVLKKMDLVASSPLLRARQTADIVQGAFPAARLILTRDLSPRGSPERLLRWLRGRGEGVIALVGHEPHLGKLLAYLTVGRQESFAELKKGQVCLLEFPSRPVAGSARLLWSLKPAHLRKLGRCRG